MNKEFRTHRSTGLLVSSDGELMWTTTYKTGHQHTWRTYGCKDKRGYRTVRYEGNYYYVHRLVAECFIPNPDGKTEVDHINTNRSDNRVENLRWLTRGENCNDPLTLQKMSEAQKGKKLSGEHISKISEAHKGIKQSEEWVRNSAEARKKPIIGTHKITGETITFDSAMDAWLALNINSCNITSCCKGRVKSAGGYVWRYKRENEETTLNLRIPLIINLKKHPEILRNVKMT